jgi:hypothetical protein
MSLNFKPLCTVAKVPDLDLTLSVTGSDTELVGGKGQRTRWSLMSLEVENLREIVAAEDANGSVILLHD